MQWLIDGHNLIGHMPDLQLSDPDDEEKLLLQLRGYRARTGHGLTVVFDAGPSYQGGKTIKKGGITVQFAPPGRSADQIIIRRIRRVKNPQGVMVVSSDRVIQNAAAQANIRILDSGSFARQLQPAVENEASGPVSRGQQADLTLSPEEVEEWLDLFNQTDS